MRICNVMLSRDLGGIQQAFLDYSSALELEKFDVINVTSTGAKINLFDECKPRFKLWNLNTWDFISIIYFKFKLMLFRPDIIIAHGNRAINFARLAKSNSQILIGIAHNYSIAYLRKCDYVIVLTNHMLQHLIQEKFDSDRLFLIPNMIKLNDNYRTHYLSKPKDQDNTIIIGALARFVPKKGIDMFLKSISILKQQKYLFKVLIGGDGDEKQNLLQLSHDLNLGDEVSFIGWVKDRKHFFDTIDIFCLPSKQEPFGIILLEAMMHGVPIVSTNSEGPSEIISHNYNGLITNYSAEEFADKIATMINHPDQRAKYIKNGYDALEKRYSINIVSQELSQLIHAIINK